MGTGTLASSEQLQPNYRLKQKHICFWLKSIIDQKPGLVGVTINYGKWLLDYYQKQKKNQQQQDIMLTYKKIKTLVYSEMEHTRENKPRFTLAAAYIRH